MTCNDKEMLQLQYKTALDIRKFEIDLYWRRTTYFWAFITVFFGLLFMTYTSDNPKIEHIFFARFVISCVGVLVTYCWFHVCKGSKFWQVNWENKVTDFEDKLKIDVYKSLSPEQGKNSKKWENLKKPKIDGILNDNRSSVTKLNQLVTFLFLCVWVLLIVFTFCDRWFISGSITLISTIWFYLIGFVFAILAWRYIVCRIVKRHEKFLPHKKR